LKTITVGFTLEEGERLTMSGSSLVGARLRSQPTGDLKSGKGKFPIYFIVGRMK